MWVGRQGCKTGSELLGIFRLDYVCGMRAVGLRGRVRQSVCGAELLERYRIGFDEGDYVASAEFWDFGS